MNPVDSISSQRETNTSNLNTIPQTRGLGDRGLMTDPFFVYGPHDGRAT